MIAITLCEQYRLSFCSAMFRSADECTRGSSVQTSRLRTRWSTSRSMDLSLSPQRFKYAYAI